MLSPMASAGIPLPGRGGFFSGCDPNVHQQAQHSQHRAQSQAQINLLQQQNDLLSQQLAHQVTSQVPSTRQLPTASFQPASSNQSTPPPQPSSNVEPASTSTPTASTFDSSEMEVRLQESFKKDIKDAVRRSRPLHRPKPKTSRHLPFAHLNPFLSTTGLQSTSIPCSPCYLGLRLRSRSRAPRRDDSRQRIHLHAAPATSKPITELSHPTSHHRTSRRSKHHPTFKKPSSTKESIQLEEGDKLVDQPLG